MAKSAKVPLYCAQHIYGFDVIRPLNGAEMSPCLYWKLDDALASRPDGDETFGPLITEYLYTEIRKVMVPERLKVKYPNCLSKNEEFLPRELERWDPSARQDSFLIFIGIYTTSANKNSHRARLGIFDRNLLLDRRNIDMLMAPTGINPKDIDPDLLKEIPR